MKKLLFAVLLATFALTPIAEAREWRRHGSHHVYYYPRHHYYRPYYYNTGYYGYPVYAYDRGCGYGDYYGGYYGGYYGHRRHGAISFAFGF